MPSIEMPTRIPLLQPSEMTPAQKALYDAVVSGPRGQMIGPLRAAIHSPELAALWSRFGEFLRYRTCLPPKVTELAILATARRYTSQVEWWVHAAIARDAGLAQSVIDAIAQGAAPFFDDEACRDAYECTRLLQETGQVPAELHAMISRRWGVRGVVELTSVIGYYTLVAMTLNAHEIPLPDGVDLPLARQRTLVALAPAANTRQEGQV